MAEQRTNLFYSDVLIDGSTPTTEVLHAFVPVRSWMAMNATANPIGTALNAFAKGTGGIDRQGCYRFEDYILSSFKNAGESQHLIFHQNYALINPVTGLAYFATPVLQTQEFGNHEWPSILRRITPKQDLTVMRASRNVDPQTGKNSVFLTPTINVFDDVVEEAHEGTKFTIDLYLNNTPFVVPQTEVPITHSISFPLPGGERITHRRCLNPKHILHPQSTGTQFIADDGTQNPGGGVIPGQFIPATNFPDWQPYVVSRKPGQVEGGLFSLTVLTAYPPQEPKATLLLV